MRKPLAIIILMYFFIMPCVLAIGETDVYQIQNGEDDVIMTETLALDTDGPYIILKDYDVSYKIGLRFTNINISRGETITEAILSVYCKYDFPNGTGTVTIYGLKVADAPVLDEPEDLSGPLTDSYVIWNISDVKGPDKWHNVTITPIIQEIVNQYGWESGNSLALIILSEKGNIRRQFTSADYMNPAKLYITIAPPTPPEENYELIQTYKGYEIYNHTIYIGDTDPYYYDLGDLTTWEILDSHYSRTSNSITFTQIERQDNCYVRNASRYDLYNFTIAFNITITDIYSRDDSNGVLLQLIALCDAPSPDNAQNLFMLSINEDGSSDTTYGIGKSIKINGVSTYSSTGAGFFNVSEEYRIILERRGEYLNVSLANIEYEVTYEVGPNPYTYIVILRQKERSSDLTDYISGIFEKAEPPGSYNITWSIEIWDDDQLIAENFTSLDDAISYIDNVLIGPEEQPYNPEIGGYEVIPRRYVKLGFLVSGLGLMMVGLIAISYKPTLGRAIMGILMIVLAMGLLIHLTQI